MSLTLREAGNLKPELRLAKAVSEFEATLLPEQKYSFQASRAQAVSTAPTMSDVMRLTAEIDLKATSKHGRGRCFGPRMTNTLQAIQQFAALGDIIVGGSQNLIACGVWAAARMTLHVITGYFTYLENLSLLLMAIGRNAPRYQTMASLYPKSKSLQRYLCEYFIVITKLCHHSITWTQKPALSRLSSIIGDPQMKTFKDDFDLWSSAIKEETNVLLNQTVVEEAKQNSLFRSFATSRSDASAHQRKIERQIRYLDACSQYDYRTNWKQTRKCGSTKILTTCHPYQDWKLEFEAKSILFLGKLGAGKSVLLANIVDVLNLDNDSITIYFFARHNSEESMRARTILGCLIRQLLERLMTDTAFSHLFPDNKPHLDLDDVVNLFKQAKPTHTVVSIVLDGLDECEMGVQQTVLEHLRQIQTFGYKVCLSVRTSEKGQIWSPRSFQFHVSIPERNPDITDFVETEVENRVKDGRLVTSDPNLVKDIKHELTTRSHGMFLWTSLQLDSICSEVSDHDIRQAIQNLPRDLTETFRRNLAKATLNDHKRHHIRIFKILVGAKELLTAEQLRQAAGVTIGQIVWNSKKEVNSIHPLLKFCGSMVMVDEEDDTVRFIHHSARSFCIKGSHSATNWAFSELEADQHIAEILVTFLSYNVFDTQVSRNVVPMIDAKGMPRRVAWNTLSSYQIGRHIAEKALTSTSLSKRDIGPTLTQATMNHPNTEDKFPLLVYAKSNWIKHTSRLAGLRLPQWYNLLDHPSFGIDRDQLPITMPVSASSTSHTDPCAFVVRNRKGHKLIPPQRLSSVSLPVPHGSSNIWWALSNGHILVLKHELTMAQGTQRIRNYVMLWSLLRRLALVAPHFISKDLDYDFVRWLSPMVENLPMDHPAKRHFLERIRTTDGCYMTLVRKAVKERDLIAIHALCRSDYIFQSDFLTVQLTPLGANSDHRDYVPLILKALLSDPPRLAAIKWIMNSHDLWLFDLATWFSRVDWQDFDRRVGPGVQLSFWKSLKSLEWAKVAGCEVERLDEVLKATRDQLKNESNLENLLFGLS